MNRSQVEYLSNELLEGEHGLWLTVLIGLLKDIENPLHRKGYQEARRIILKKEGCFPILAEALGLESDALQKRILRSLMRKGIDLRKDMTQE